VVDEVVVVSLRRCYLPSAWAAAASHDTTHADIH
jgi:hypothetical protein